MQQYLVLCAGVEHEDEINPALLEFRSTRQQLEDGAFVFPASRLPQGAAGTWSRPKGDSQPVAAAGGSSGRRGQPRTQSQTHSRTFSWRRERHLAGVPRSRPKWTDPEHVLQVAKREVRQELFLERPPSPSRPNRRPPYERG
ncbi:hypothetical protein MHU86_25067 [Fragilaria crotonensis]|nr:hypothetical protein MHU86_25067 [Fragilaria crotonensis]